jgi:prepilin-type N-terminal cleavage/methylation domain-containing protein
MRRRGYTLIEIVLVLAVIVIAASLALPYLNPMMDQAKVTAARDLVRARWAETRAHAMGEGRPYRFAVTENTGRFRIAPDDQVYWSGEGMPDDAEKPLIVEGQLPDGVVFATSDNAFADESSLPSAGADWDIVVAIYLADGTARDDAELWFGKAGARPLGLHLRGLTGAVTALDQRLSQGVAP